MENVDYKLYDSGSIITVQPMHTGADAFLRDVISEESTWFGTALAVEPRYISDLVNGLRKAGYIVDDVDYPCEEEDFDFDDPVFDAVAW